MDRPSVRTPPPGPKAKAIIDRDHAALLRATKTHPLVVKRAHGCFIEDVDGNVFLDFTAGIGVLNTGHGHPAVAAAVERQMKEFVHGAATDFYHEPQTLLAERLARLAPGGGPRKVFFGNSGTEAVEACVKVARWATRRPLFLAFLGAFHGRTMGALAFTASKRSQRERFLPAFPGVFHVPFPNPYRNPWGVNGYDDPKGLTDRALAYVADVLDALAPAPDVAACILEPVQGEGGYVVPPAGFPTALHRLLKEHGILLIADEVQSGIGRTGKLFASEHFGLAPDLLAVAKALSSGFPIGACIARADLDFTVDGAHSNTFGGNAVSCAAGLATLDVLEKEDLAGNAGKRGEELRKGLEELQERYPVVGDVRGLGLMQATELVKSPVTKEAAPKERDAVTREALKRGLLLLPCGKSAIRYIPPLTVSSSEVQMGLDVLDQSFKAVFR